MASDGVADAEDGEGLGSRRLPETVVVDHEEPSVDRSTAVDEPVSGLVPSRSGVLDESVAESMAAPVTSLSGVATTGKNALTAPVAVPTPGFARHQPGNSYEGMSFSGSSKNMLGNTYDNSVKNKIEFNFWHDGRGDKNQAIEERKSQVLQHLKFYGMDEKIEDIKDPHKKTFEWIYKDTDLQFVPWLHQHHGTFWISGKAGSGKSTLTKFVFGDPRTREILESKTTNLLIAGFFFHDRGSNPLLKSQAGLYRAILYQVLSSFPALIPVVFPERWQELEFLTDWSIQELKNAIKALGTQKVVQLHLFLVVDGLDEFSGDHNDIVEALNNLLPKEQSNIVQVQLLVSSRPLPVFERAYTKNPHLKVQQLTRPDIENYVIDKFREVDMMEDVMKLEPSKMNQILFEIQDKASGVFLWVYLVVRSLIEGIQGHDTMDDLQRRLNKLPSGLEPLYKRMIENIDPFYHGHAAQLFQIVQCANSVRPLSPLSMSFVEEEPRIIHDQRELELMSKSIPEREKMMQQRLKYRSAGLIEIGGDDGQPTVQFLHLTVKEYLITPEMQMWLSTNTPPEFNPHERIVSSCLRQCQLADWINGLWEVGYFGFSNPRHLEFSILSHCYMSEKNNGRCLFPYIHVLNSLLETHLVPGEEIGEYHWTARRYNDWIEPENWHSDLVAYLVSSGMTKSVSSAIESGYEVSKKKGRPIIFYALGCVAPLYAVGDQEFLTVDADVVEIILQNGGNPNASFTSGYAHSIYNGGPQTAWEAALTNLHDHRVQGKGLIKYQNPDTLLTFQSSCLRIIEMFLSHGVDAPVNYRDSFLPIFDDIFSGFEDPKVKRVRNALIKMERNKPKGKHLVENGHGDGILVPDQGKVRQKNQPQKVKFLDKVRSRFRCG